MSASRQASPSVRVAAQDALGNTVTGFTGSITVAITPGTGAAGAGGIAPFDAGRENPVFSRRPDAEGLDVFLL